MKNIRFFLLGGLLFFLYSCGKTPLDESASAEPAGMVALGGITFNMGSNDPSADVNETPLNQVTVSAFFMDKYEVSVGDYKKCVNDTVDTSCSSFLPPGTSGDCTWDKEELDFPINCVNWQQAKTYCEWAGKRLPTEAEWERAAKMNSQEHKFPLSKSQISCSDFHACKTDGDPFRKVKLGTAEINRTYNMAGNVAEWTEGDFLNYGKSPILENRVVKGGHLKSNLKDLRGSARRKEISDAKIFEIGFRCAK